MLNRDLPRLPSSPRALWLFLKEAVASVRQIVNLLPAWLYTCNNHRRALANRLPSCWREHPASAGNRTSPAAQHRAGYWGNALREI